MNAIYLHATTYYVDNSLGNDSLSGKSKTSPWKTIYKVNNSTFQPGDSVLLKKGEIWKEFFDFPSSGNLSSPIVLGSYGDGDLPIITGIDEYLGWNNSNNWTSEGNNLWSRDQSYNPQRLWIDSKEVLRNEEIDSLDGIKYIWAWENSKIYIYSSTNPATAFASMETIVFYNVARIGDKNNIIIQNIEFQGGYDFCMAIRGSNNITVKDCNIGSFSRQGIKICDNNGISSTNIGIDNCLLDSKFSFSYGKNKGIDDGIQINSGANDCIVKNCEIKDFGHAGIYLRALYATDNGVFNNKIVGNLITGENVTYQRGLNTDGYENKCRDNEIYYNIIRNTTVVNQINGNNNWAHHNIVDGVKNSIVKSFPVGQGFCLQAYGPDLVCHDNKIDNNLIMNCDEPGIYFQKDINIKKNNFVRNNLIINCGLNSKVGFDNIGIAVDNSNSIASNFFYNNCVYNENSDAPTIFIRGEYLTADQFNNLGSFVDIAANNIHEDPLLVTFDYLNYFLLENSPCIDAGMDIGLQFDFYGNSISGEAPDIGIYEYSSSTKISDEKTITADKFILEQNYPNPFNPSTVIRYSLPVRQAGIPPVEALSSTPNGGQAVEVHMSLIVYDILGNEVKTLVSENQVPGDYKVTFNASGLSSGVYIYKLQTSSGFVSTKKLILIK